MASAPLRRFMPILMRTVVPMIGCALRQRGSSTKVKDEPRQGLIAARQLAKLDNSKAKNYHRSCMHEPQFVNLTGHVDKILKYHNDWRHGLANGNNVSLPRAARMVVMHWSDELATVASYNVRMCQAKHDDCRNTHNFTHSGQNIIVFNMTRLVQDELLESLYPELLSIGVRNWWSEHNNMTKTDVELYPCDKKRQQYYRHFAVMALESNSHVGCAAVRYVIKDVTYFKVTCNYAKDTVCGQPIYSFRTVGCLTGVNAKYKSLCSEKEVFA
ncbi:uncharacterized protein Dwil_GK24020 [Drosophila willistoni]|uniref:SCP domain-containing protein n=1 Tax=Drosophila willistoni TaxID=7260 RepID=B4N6T7_DROWI|nr:uncharacterized protein Dwil_GK24020 [Drosophila willistoni]